MFFSFWLMFSRISTSNSFLQPLSAEEERECLMLVAEGNKEARNRLVLHNMRLVAFIARRYQNTTSDSEDLISVGTVGLIKAIQTFNASKGNKLATYASKCIDNEILMYLRTLRKTGNDISLQAPMGVDHEGNEITLEDKLEDLCCGIDEQVELKMQIAELCSKLGAALKPREREIIEKRYGLSGGEELTQREIAGEMDISRSYVSRIEKKALGKLFNELNHE